MQMRKLYAVPCTIHIGSALFEPDLSRKHGPRNRGLDHITTLASPQS